jgi:hypothetical protein
MITIVGTIVGVIAIFKVYKRMIKDPEFTKDSSYESKFSSLTDGIKMNMSPKRRFILSWKGLILGRWILTIAILIFLKDSCHIQIYLLLMISIAAQGFLFSSQPYLDKDDNLMAIIIEVSVSIYLYLALSLQLINEEQSVEPRN